MKLWILSRGRGAGGGWGWGGGVSAFASTEHTTVGDLLEVLDSHSYLVIGTLDVFEFCVPSWNPSQECQGLQKDTTHLAEETVSTDMVLLKEPLDFCGAK